MSVAEGTQHATRFTRNPDRRRGSRPRFGRDITGRFCCGGTDSRNRLRFCGTWCACLAATGGRSEQLLRSSWRRRTSVERQDRLLHARRANRCVGMVLFARSDADRSEQTPLHLHRCLPPAGRIVRAELPAMRNSLRRAADLGRHSVRARRLLQLGRAVPRLHRTTLDARLCLR